MNLNVNVKQNQCQRRSLKSPSTTFSYLRRERSVDILFRPDAARVNMFSHHPWKRVIDRKKVVTEPLNKHEIDLCIDGRPPHSLSTSSSFVSVNESDIAEESNSDTVESERKRSVILTPFEEVYASDSDDDLSVDDEWSIHALGGECERQSFDELFGACDPSLRSIFSFQSQAERGGLSDELSEKIEDIDEIHCNEGDGYRRGSDIYEDDDASNCDIWKFSLRGQDYEPSLRILEQVDKDDDTESSNRLVEKISLRSDDYSEPSKKIIKDGPFKKLKALKKRMKKKIFKNTKATAKEQRMKVSCDTTVACTDSFEEESGYFYNSQRMSCILYGLGVKSQEAMQGTTNGI